MAKIKPLPERIIGKFARNYKIKTSTLKGLSRKSRIVRVRDKAIYEIWLRSELSYEEIGRYFSNRTPAAILHSIQKEMAKAA